MAACPTPLLNSPLAVEPFEASWDLEPKPNDIAGGALDALFDAHAGDGSDLLDAISLPDLSFGNLSCPLEVACETGASPLPACQPSAPSLAEGTQQGWVLLAPAAGRAGGQQQRQSVPRPSCSQPGGSALTGLGPLVPHLMPSGRQQGSGQSIPAVAPQQWRQQQGTSPPARGQGSPAPAGSQQRQPEQREEQGAPSPPAVQLQEQSKLGEEGTPAAAAPPAALSPALLAPAWPPGAPQQPAPQPPALVPGPHAGEAGVRAVLLRRYYMALLRVREQQLAAEAAPGPLLRPASAHALRRCEHAPPVQLGLPPAWSAPALLALPQLRSDTAGCSAAGLCFPPRAPAPVLRPAAAAPGPVAWPPVRSPILTPARKRARDAQSPPNPAPASLPSSPSTHTAQESLPQASGSGAEAWVQAPAWRAVPATGAAWYPKEEWEESQLPWAKRACSGPTTGGSVACCCQAILALQQQNTALRQEVAHLRWMLWAQRDPELAGRPQA